jgi:hypothetical protein
MKKPSLSLFLFLGLMITLGASTGRAQVVGPIEADIQFPFYAGDTKFPPGTYIIKPLDTSDLTLMEISTPDGRNSALFQVRDAQASTSPPKTELIFNKYGDNYFLSKVFDQGNKLGSALEESRYQKKLISGGATVEDRHVSARRRTQ